MFLIIFGRADKNVPWMRVAVYKPILKNHLGEYFDQVLCTNNRVHSHLLDLFLLIYLCPRNKLHHNNPLRTKLIIILGNVHIRVVFKQLFGFLCIINFRSEIELLHQRSCECLIQLDQINVPVILLFH